MGGFLLILGSDGVKPHHRADGQGTTISSPVPVAGLIGLVLYAFQEAATALAQVAGKRFPLPSPAGWG
jgi:hypothetical protein